MTAEDESHILDLLRRDGVLSAGSVQVTSLGVWVPSDVFLVYDQAKRFVVKRALPYLKVKDVWPADTSRNRVESEFLQYLSRVIPAAVPAVLSVGATHFV